MSEWQAKLNEAAESAAAGAAGRPVEERADAVEFAMAIELDRLAVRSVIYWSGEEDPTAPKPVFPPEGQYLQMGQDPRLPPMPAKPTLIDFFKLRFQPAQHLLQSAALAQQQGHDEKIVLACLLHDISNIGFIRADHGYWGAQLVEPYVDKEVSFAIRHHQALRFFEDLSVGYAYPELYVRLFGPDYRPPGYVRRAYERARKHRWYMSARLVTLNDLYAWDPDASVSLEDFTDVIGRNFRQPKEGLGYDASPSAHMWRTMIAPTRAL
jgi:hypothetical protein